MDRISELKDILSGFCHWNKARIDCFARMLVSLLKVRTVNLREIAVGFESTAEIESRYRRLKRFFSGFEFDRLAISKWLFTLFRFEETHMTHPQRIDKLMALLAIGFAWAHKVGEWRALCKPIILNQYVNMTRPQFSFFRYGLDFLRNLFLQHKTSDFKQLLKLITLPKAILNEVLL